jgi:transposase
MRSREAGDRPAFPPHVVVEVKRIACELPSLVGVPLARWSLPDLRREVLARGLVATVSGTTLWRWLDADAIRPWRHRSWLFPRDSRFAECADPILDLYERCWAGCPLGPRDYVISADEKTSIQARQRRHAPAPVSPRRTMRVEHEYHRRGAWAYLAAWDVHRARLCGRCEVRSGIAAFDRLVEQVMSQEPYRSARRVFWVMDNGSAHRGAKGDARLRDRWPTLVPVHTPRHASWLNQIEIYFSIVQRKVLTPNDFATLATLEHYLMAFQHRYQAAARPFRWTFTRADLHQLLAKLATGAESVRPAA